MAGGTGCGGPGNEEKDNICDPLLEYYEHEANIEHQQEIDYSREQQQVHEDAEKKAEQELERLHQQTLDKRTEEAIIALQQVIDEERGKVVFWQTKTEQLEGVGTTGKGTFERSLPQQNMKDEKGDHTFYDPRSGRSGVAFGDSPRKGKK